MIFYLKKNRCSITRCAEIKFLPISETYCYAHRVRARNVLIGWQCVLVTLTVTYPRRIWAVYWTPEKYSHSTETHSHGIRQKVVARWQSIFLPSPRNKETENMPKWLLFIIVNVCKFGFLSILFFSISNNSTPYGRGLGVLTHLYELTN